MRRIGAAERRARLWLRHRLAPATRANDPLDVARDLVGLHSTEPASVFVAAWARMRTAEPAAIERALYEDRTLVRMLGMRGTLFVVPIELAPVLHAACARPAAARARQLLLRQFDQAAVAEDPARWLADVQRAALDALAVRGEATAVELAQLEPRLRTQVVAAGPAGSDPRQSIAIPVLLLLAAEGRVIRARPRGSWVNSQYRWASTARWLADTSLESDLSEWQTADARVELVRRWLASYGPGTVRDLRWWTGWTAAELKLVLTEIRPIEVDLDGAPGLLLADDTGAAPAVEPAARLLPTLDSTVMGWADRGWYLGDHRARLFDQRGNGGPTVWWNGRVVGGWAQRKNGEIAYRLLEDVGADGVAAVAAEAERLAGWLGAVRVTPRFRTPLERELCS